MNKLVAFVGMSGSGKSVGTDYLEKKGWKKLYFGGITLKKMEEEGIEITPDNEKIMREKLRKEHGPECYTKLLLPDIEESLKENNVVLDGLYSWYEYKFLESIFGDRLKLICIITDKSLRYERIAKRSIRPFNNQKIKERDISEIENLYKGGPIAYANYFIFNNKTLEDYEKRLEEILKEI